MSLTHPDLQEVTIRWRGSFGCTAAWAGEGDDNDKKIPLCRTGYLGDDDDPGIYTGHPNDAYDIAAITHLTDYKK